MNHPPQQERFNNPWGWPEEVLPVLQRFLTCEHATMSVKGQPVTYPVTPYIGNEGCTLDVSTGLTYPAKAERVRRNPKTCLLFSNPIGSELDNAPMVLVYGMGAVRDAHLQDNTDRYIRLAAMRKFLPPMPSPILHRMQWYLVRIWIEVMPVRILWWRQGDLDQPPQRWDIPPGQIFPTSDPVPDGPIPPRWKEAPADWHERAAYAADHLGLPVLTIVDDDGFPVPFRVKHIKEHASGFVLQIPEGVPGSVKGLACLTFHQHPEDFAGQENMVFIGETEPSANKEVVFKVDHCPGDWSLPPKGMAAIWSFLSSGRKLAPRLRAEAQRRNQPVPAIRLG